MLTNAIFKTQNKILKLTYITKNIKLTKIKTFENTIDFALLRFELALRFFNKNPTHLHMSYTDCRGSLLVSICE